jgi:hypothetical protein
MASTQNGGLDNAQMRELMVMSKKLGKLNQSRAQSFAKLSSKYEKLLTEYTPYTQDEESKLGEDMVSELGDIASLSINKKNSKSDQRSFTYLTHILGLENLLKKFSTKRKELQLIMD